MRNTWLDAHHHLWQYSAQEYPWIGAGMQAIARDFTLQQLEPLAADAAVTGCIAVQARSTLAETDWLLELARSSQFLQGIIGWVPLIDPAVEQHLDRLAAAPTLVGIRHILEGEPDPAYMLRDDFNAGLALLEPRNLAYDILIKPALIPNAIQLVDRHPHQVFVLDHLAKPPIAAGEITQWRDDIRQLAERPNVSCKLSGMVTEADWKHWSIDTLQPYFDVVLEAFGPSRLLYGSDWPVLNLAADYASWRDTVATLLAPLSDPEADAIMQATAIRTYRIGPANSH